jgi:cytochrome c biogenesis protein CcdA
MKTVYQQPIPTREERAASLRETEREATRQMLREMAVTIACCFVSTLIGVVIVSFSAHTGDERTGWILFYAGMTVGYTGNLVTLFIAFRRGQERGDW